VPRDVRLAPATAEVRGLRPQAADQRRQARVPRVAARRLAQVRGQVARELLGVLRVEVDHPGRLREVPPGDVALEALQRGRIAGERGPERVPPQ
jgi:hypothetical protein